MTKSKLALVIVVALAAVWQALGASLYMGLFGQATISPIIYALVKVVMVALPLAALLVGWRPAAFLRGANKTDILLGLALGAVFFAVIVGVYLLAPNLFVVAKLSAIPRAAAFGLNVPATLIVVGIVFAVLHSLFEEFYWRWFIFGALRTIVTTPIAVALGGLAFSLHHIIILSAFVIFPIAIIGGLSVGAVGSLWSYMYNRRGTLVAPWLSHILADLAIVVVSYLMLFGN